MSDLPMDAYVRVSVVGGRSGERFQSPDQQRESIAAWAKAHGVTIGEWHEDLDWSGGTMDRPGMNLALERVAKGRSGGVIVARLDRFARTVVGGLTTIRELDERGARVVSVAESLDPATPMGRAMLGLLLIMAEWQRDQANEHLAAAQSRAASAGRFPGKCPYGYQRTEDGLTIIDPDAAAVVRRIFLERGAGRGWRIIANDLSHDRIPTARGKGLWSHSTLFGIVKSESAMGVFVGPRGLRVEDAWEPIVTREEWERANVVGGRQDSERKHIDRLLAGQARCAHCRHTMRRTVNQNGTVSYYCRIAPCAAKASVAAHLVDPYVEAMVDERLAKMALQPRLAEPSDELAAAISRRDATAEAFESWRDDLELRNVIGDQDYREGLLARARARDDAESDLADLRARTGLLTGEELPAGVTPKLAELPWDVRRRIVGALVHAVWIRRAEVRGPQHAMRHPERRFLVAWKDDPSAPALPASNLPDLGPVDW